MLIIRLQRVGRTNRAEFRIVVAEHKKSAKSGKFIEVLGHHNPHTDETVFDEEKVKTWITKGTQVSDTMHNIFVSKGVIKGKKRNVLPKKTVPAKEQAAEATAEAAAPAETTEPVAA